MADATYEVHENAIVQENLIKPSDVSTSSQSCVGSSFGAYTHPTYHSDVQPLQPPNSLKSNKSLKEREKKRKECSCNTSGCVPLSIRVQCPCYGNPTIGLPRCIA